MQCGRVGSRLLLLERSFEQSNGRFFCLCPLWAFHKSHLFSTEPKSLRKRFGISAHGESRFPNGLAFPRMAKVISRKVWHFRAWRKSFPEWFGVSAHGESHFPNGLIFPRLAEVVSRMVWSFRAWRKSFHESLDNLTPKDVYLGQGERIKKIREIIKQNSINKRIFDNKTMKYQSK